MLLSLLKWTCFAIIILLLGQIRLGGETIASRLEGQLGSAVAWGGREVRASQAYSKVARSQYVPGWIRKKLRATPRATRPEAPADYRPQKAAAPAEEISESDRESLLRLLE